VQPAIVPTLPPGLASALRAAGFRPDRVGIVGTSSLTRECTALSYAELGRQVDCIAHNPARRGIGRNDVVSDQSPNWREFVSLHLAALWIGALGDPVVISRALALG